MVRRTHTHTCQFEFCVQWNNPDLLTMSRTPAMGLVQVHLHTGFWLTMGIFGTRLFCIENNMKDKVNTGTYIYGGNFITELFIHQSLCHRVFFHCSPQVVFDRFPQSFMVLKEKFKTHPVWWRPREVFLSILHLNIYHFIRLWIDMRSQSGGVCLCDTWHRR